MPFQAPKAPLITKCVLQGAFDTLSRFSTHSELGTFGRSGARGGLGTLGRFGAPGGIGAL